MKSPTLCPTSLYQHGLSAGLAPDVFAVKVAEKLGIPCGNIARAHR